jgi:hypothetical protein
MPRVRCTISRVRLFRPLPPVCPATIASAILCLILTTSLRAQERVRTSAAAPLIESFRRSPEAFFYLGPFQEELGGSVGVQYTDNVSLAATDKISDLSFSQALNLNTTWVISHLNQLQFNFGGQVMENFYGNGRRQTTFAIDPNSKLEFKFSIGDLRVRLYDEFSFDQNPASDPTATNTANLNSLTNTFGAVVEADLNLAILSLFADYTYNNQSGTDAQGTANPSTTGSRQTFRVGSDLTFRLSPAIIYGLNLTATRSTGSNSANVNSLNFGPFMNGKLSRNFEFDLAFGGTLIETEPAIPPGYYASAAIRWQINRHWQFLLSGSHDFVFTTGTGLTEETLFRMGTQMDLTRLISFTAAPFVDFGDTKTTTAGTTPSSQGAFTQYGFGASLGWRPRRRWSTALSYQYTRRESASAVGVAGAASGNYIQNSISFSINYAF